MKAIAKVQVRLSPAILERLIHIQLQLQPPIGTCGQSSLVNATSSSPLSQRLQASRVRAGLSTDAARIAAANLPRSRGCEGMALNASGTKLYAMLEGPLISDSQRDRLLINEFDQF